MAAFDDLIAGYRRFMAGDWAAERARWTTLAAGQSPRVMVVACSDSRVDPSQIFDVTAGEIFVVRNVANLVPPFEVGGGRHGVSAALEFAVTQLRVEEIVVMGHGACGGANAALTQSFREAAPGEGGFIAGWIDLLDKARDKVAAAHGTTGADAAQAMEHETVKVSLANLMTFPFVADRVAAGTLKLRGAWFAIASGELHVLDPTTGDFFPAQDRHPSRSS